MTVTAAARGRANRRKGHDTEREVAKYLRTVGFPGAERAVRTGFNAGGREVADPGDITGIPGLVWQVKNVAREDITGWMREAEEQAIASGADLGILVQRRTGKANPARWWAWIDMNSLGLLISGRLLPLHEARFPIRMELGDLVALLHLAGYGDKEATA